MTLMVSSCLFIVFLTTGLARYFAGLPVARRPERWAIWLGFGVSHVLFGALALRTGRPLLAAVGAFFASLAVMIVACWRGGTHRPAPLPPVVALSASVAGRRLRDFTRWPLELAIVAIDVAALAAGSPGLWVLLYGQLLLFLTKHIVVKGSMPLPAAAAAEHEESRNQRLHLVCGFLDRFRGVCALAALGTAVAPKMFALPGLLLAGYCLWDLNQAGNRTEALARELEQRTGFPDVLPWGAYGHFLGGGMLYWNPEHDTPVVQGPLGYTLNAANPWAGLYVASLAGFLALFARYLGAL